MGCFDYECACGGSTCEYKGGQDCGDSTAVIEVPLNDGTTVYVKGHYNSYGEVKVKDYTFYPEQFQEYYTGWLESKSDEQRSKIFRGKRIWTMKYKHYDDEYNKRIVKDTNCYPENIKINTTVGVKTLAKCIRADDGLNIRSDKEKNDERIKYLTGQLEAIQRELAQLRGVNP